MNNHNSKEMLIQGMIAYGALRTPKIIEAFRVIDRKYFVPDWFADEIYGDYPLPIGEDQTISQPTTVAFMLELLGAEEGDRVLDIGSGSGWTTALLGHIVGERGEVIGLERQHSLVEQGRRNIRPFHFSPVRIEEAGEQLGMPGERFDAILASASAPEIPEQLFEQLKPGGRLVLPVQDSVYRFVKESETEIQREEYPGFIFVPLIYQE
ncbi:MAG: protein-L-isoaspartate O-methyltransferase [Campylobacterales bacterium]